MSKKELIKFGIKGIDAFQDNYKIFFDRLVRGYRSMMGKDPEGLDLLKVKMEARDKAMQTTKVVNMKGKTLDPNKPITGGTQEGIETIKIKELDDFNLSKDDPMGDLEKIVKGEGDTGLPKNYTRPFGDNIRDAYGKAGRSREEATEMVEALNSPGAKSSYQIMEETLGVRLYGDETFEELMKIKETGVHPRGEPPIKKADGGRIGFKDGNGVADEDAEKAALGKRVRELMDEGFDFGDAVKQAIKEGYKAGGRVGYSRGKLVLKGIETLFSGAKKNKKLTDDEYQDFVDEVGGADQLEAYDFDGTAGDAQRILREQKEYMDDMFSEYKAGKLDPTPGELSRGRLKQLQDRLEEMEMSGDTRLMSRDDFDELNFLEKKFRKEDLDIKAQVGRDMTEEEIAELKALSDMDYAKGGRVPAAPSQLVSESDIILGYRGEGGYQGGRNDNTASDTGPGGGATDKGPSFTGDSIGPSSPRDLGFIDSGPTVNPNLTKKGPNIISAPDSDPRFDRYNPSTFDPGNRNIFQQGFDLVKRAVTNPFTRNLGLAALGPLGYGKLANQIRTGLMAKGLLDSLGPMTDATIEDELEAITTGTDVTGQTTALYKDGGLVTLFTEKR